MSHQLRGDIYEFIKGRIRILYFYHRGQIVVCTHGLIKQSKKIKNAEIERAEAVMQAYRAAVSGGTLEILEEEEDGN